MKFDKLGLNNQLESGLDMMGFEKATPIQEKAIPIILQGKDLIACAQTGTGKTAAFVLPILSLLSEKKQENKVKALIIAPTRELAKQIDMQIEGFSYYTNSSSYPIYGGGTGPEFENQKQALIKGTDIIICTPGRLMAHLKFNYFDTNSIDYLILDEADRMLDMGFYDDIITIANKLPKKRQTLLFSATMPLKIRKLAQNILINPENISLAISKPASGIKQSAYLTHDEQKIKLIKSILQKQKKEKALSHVLIFASSIKSVKEIKKMLNRSGFKASDMHSGLDQDQREETIRDFKNKKINILVATDILSRGIDIKGIELVINYEVPHDAEDYVHRIGRTARADNTGEAITFINSKQIRNFKDIEKLIENTIPKSPLPGYFKKGPKYELIKKKKWRKR
ncbi:MAG: DEAD/DEAH box helicase [Flavobacteriales bacterium]|nr:DEAD/DEAH box helicase [Flavobacteriales bacterium]